MHTRKHKYAKSRPEIAILGLRSNKLTHTTDVDSHPGPLLDDNVTWPRPLPVALLRPFTFSRFSWIAPWPFTQFPKFLCRLVGTRSAQGIWGTNWDICTLLGGPVSRPQISQNVVPRVFGEIEFQVTYLINRRHAKFWKLLRSSFWVNVVQKCLGACHFWSLTLWGTPPHMVITPYSCGRAVPNAIDCLFSPLGKLADRAIYFACVNFFFSSFFTMSKAISVTTGPIFTIFSPNRRHLREFSWSCPVFPIPQRTLPWQTILCHKQNTNHVLFLQFLHHMKAFWV